LAKRKQALLENIPPRNSQQETHRIERFPDAWKNSSRKLPRSSFLLLGCEVSFEFRWWDIAKCGGKPPPVIDRFQELTDRGTRFRQIPVLVTMYLFVLQCFINDSLAALA